jgi:hypothetical protein
MNEQLITFGTAKLAKEKGFDIISEYFYPDESWNQNDRIINCIEVGYNDTAQLIGNDSNGFGDITIVVSQSILQRWLREVHKIYIELIIDGWGSDDEVTDLNLCYRAFIWEVGKPKPHHNSDLGAHKYETILEVALYEALKLIK